MGPPLSRQRCRGARLGRWTLVLALLPALGLLAAAAARAQISPGKLAAPHATLEGSDHCLDCHRSGRGVDPAQCLHCHTALGERLRAGKGLHARADYRACERCHIEHQGRAFELVFWGPEGMAGFDHRQTGTPLVGAHAQRACRDCHQPAKLAAAELARRGANLERTFLGLAGACQACHQDHHGGQFAGRPAGADCASCHGQVRWQGAEGFDHAKTAFPLTAVHAGLACQRCHASQPREGQPALVRYHGLSTACADCHRDPHQGRLGGRCESCHRGRDWQTVSTAGFDHGQTRYPLAGKHQTVACTGCHPAGQSLRVAGFERCETCHRQDPHGGQFAASAGGGACAGCHGVRGFRPATFALAEHQRTAYPLEGAHRRARCDGCHRAMSPEALAAAGVALSFSGARPATVQRFRFASPACPDCHADPHAGEAAMAMDARGCRSCHQLASWQEVSFDHAATGFGLSGAHGKLGCQSCHRAVAVPAGGGAARRLPLAGAPRLCAGCHADPHQGQLARPGDPNACAACHRTDDWRPSGFDHDRDASYRLAGAHRAVACVGCHPREQRGGQTVVRYRGLGHECSDCHLTVPAGEVEEGAA